MPHRVSFFSRTYATSTDIVRVWCRLLSLFSYTGSLTSSHRALGSPAAQKFRRKHYVVFIERGVPHVRRPSTIRQFLYMHACASCSSSLDISTDFLHACVCIYVCMHLSIGIYTSGTVYDGAYHTPCGPRANFHARYLHSRNSAGATKYRR